MVTATYLVINFAFRGFYQWILKVLFRKKRLKRLPFLYCFRQSGESSNRLASTTAAVLF